MMTTEQHIEELRAELKSASGAAERRAIQVELDIAEAELAIGLADQDGWQSTWTPPNRR